MMQITAALILIAMATTQQAPDRAARAIDVETAEQLQQALAEPVQAMTIRLAAGEYHLTPAPYTDPTCGNCQDPQTQAQTTVGLHIRNSRVVLLGPTEGEAIIHTNAGYGVLVEDSPQVVIMRLTITGGARSTDGNATDGAIVVRNSTVQITNNHIRDNLGDPEVVARTVSGVMGIVGRERSDMTITGNRIMRNSWDGIALYRDAKAVIDGNVIDGVDKATGANYTGGRGVGIGITWNAKATVRHNLVTRYWKGIGIFVDGQATVQGNIVEDIITWGIALWGAGSGEPVGHIRDNIIYKTGACGVSIAAASTQKEPGELRGNIITQTAQSPAYDAPDYYCAQCALAVSRKPEHFVIAGNVFYNNRRATDDLPDHDGSEAAFRSAVGVACEGGRRGFLATSQFAKDFCGIGN